MSHDYSDLGWKCTEFGERGCFASTLKKRKKKENQLYYWLILVKTIPRPIRFFVNSEIVC